MSKGKNTFDAAEIRQIIIKTVGKKAKVEKKVLFKTCIDSFKLTPAEKKDRSSDGKLTWCKSIIGSAIAEMLREGVIELVDEYFYKLPNDVSEKDLITEDRIEEYLIELMADNVRYTKKQMFDLCEKFFDKDGDGAEKDIIHRRGGNVIARMVKNGVLIKEQGGKFSAARMSKFPNSDLGKCLEEASESEDVKKYFLRALNLKGGEFFELFSVNLLKRILERANRITKSEVTGGANDNGIDGVIEYCDALGFRDRLLIQARTRSNGTINLKEVREFYGALNSEKGTKGVFISTSTFHKEALNFCNKLPNIAYIGGNRLFELAAENSFGIKKTPKGLEIDYEFFLDGVTDN